MFVSHIKMLGASHEARGPDVAQAWISGYFRAGVSNSK
jgi:hypothetical protein